MCQNCDMIRFAKIKTPDSNSKKCLHSPFPEIAIIFNCYMHVKNSTIAVINANKNF